MKKRKTKKNKSQSQIVANPQYKRESFLYAFWCSIPLALRELPIQQVMKMGYDIDDNEFAKLVNCKSKTQFAKMYKVSRRQLDRWDASPNHQKLVEKLNKQSNVLRFKKDIDFHFTRKTIKEADAARVKLWYELFVGFKPEDEKPTQNIQIINNPKVIQLGREYDEKLKKLILAQIMQKDDEVPSDK